MSQFEGAILGMENPLLDISADVPSEFLMKYGVTLNNAILAEEKHLPIYDEIVSNYPVTYTAGGATLNSIRVAQWVIKTPGSTTYFGAVGEGDKFGEVLEESATNEGVNMLLQKTPGYPTGTCAVLVNGSELSLVANLGAANTFSPTHLQSEEAKEAINRSKIIYSSGFFLTVSVESMLVVAKHAAENSKVFCMNLSAPFLIQFFGDQMAMMMPYCDFLFGNESEAAVYGEAKGYGTDIPTIALKIAGQPKASGTRPRVVVITQGSSETIVAVQGVVRTFPVEKIPNHLLVDTNGAGDAFVGGFIAQLALDKNLDECVRAGHYCSSVIIQRSGCTFPKECEFY